MAVREYIGARYIPVFADPIQWDPTLKYEPLTVVTNEGASYVSRRYVPEGIQLDNTDYWVLWADFNAQLQHYIDEVNTFDGRIDALEDALPIADFSSQNTVSDKFPIATADITDDAVTADKIADGAISTAAIADNAVTSAKLSVTLQDNLATMRRDIDLMNFRDFVTGGNAVFIGDSYTYGTGASDHGSGDTKRWSSIVCSKLGLTEFNYAVGGTGFAKTSTVNDNFNVQIQRAINGMTEKQKANTRLVFIAGGYNDAKTNVRAGTLYSAAKVDCQVAYAAFPNALIVLIPMLWPGYGFTQTYYNCAINIADGGLWCEKPIRVLEDAWSWLFPINPSGISSDGIHPNDNGHFRIALEVISGLLGNDTSSKNIFVPSENTGYSFLSEGTGGLYLWLQNGRIHAEGARITNTSAMSPGNIYNVGTLPDGAVPRYQQYVPIYGNNQVIGSLCYYTNGFMLVNIASGSSVGAGNGFIVGSGANWLPYGIWSS